VHFCIGTNELFHVYDGFIPDNQLIALDTEDEFPDVGNIDNQVRCLLRLVFYQLSLSNYK
jgi:hypothetical protein